MEKKYLNEMIKKKKKTRTYRNVSRTVAATQQDAGAAMQSVAVREKKKKTSPFGYLS